jgi:oligosaccharide repeat unit polymerase
MTGDLTWDVLYAIDLAAIASFLVSYYLTCYRRGYRIDFWHLSIFLTCVLPGFLMLPFSRSELNAPIVGQDFPMVVEAIPDVFLITLLGYFAILVGGGLWRLRAGAGIRKTAMQVIEVLPRCSRMLMSSPGLLVFQSLICISFQALVLAIYFAQNGFGFDLRAFTFANPTLRPVAVAVSSYSVIIGSHCLARYVEKKERLLLACVGFLALGLVFFGSRASLFSICLNIFICHFIRQRRRTSLFRLVAIGGVLVATAFYLGSARAGDYSLADFFTAFALILLYGNNFSDLRDFAWVYARWDHVLWAGKTYLVAVTAFVPRFASQFRDTWGLGVVTAATLGLDPHVHPGVRPGYFGESFFNFGVVGVIAVGLGMGIIFRRVDIDVKRNLAGPRPSMMNAFASTAPLSLAGCLAVSANLSSLYVVLGIYLFSWFCLSIQRLVWPRRLILRSNP